MYWYHAHGGSLPASTFLLAQSRSIVMQVSTRIAIVLLPLRF
jgi:hypothetical protein